MPASHSRAGAEKKAVDERFAFGGSIGRGIGGGWKRSRSGFPRWSFGGADPAGEASSELSAIRRPARVDHAKSAPCASLRSRARTRLAASRVEMGRGPRDFAEPRGP